MILKTKNPKLINRALKLGAYAALENKITFKGSNGIDFFARTELKDRYVSILPSNKIDIYIQDSLTGETNIPKKVLKSMKKNTWDQKLLFSGNINETYIVFAEKRREQ